MSTLQKRLQNWAKIVLALLLIPLIGEFTVEGWNWGVEGFIFAFIMWFGTACVYEFLTRNMQDKKYRASRIAIGAAVFLLLAFIWGMLATSE